MDDGANYPSVHIHVLQFHGTIALFQLHLSTMLIVEGHSCLITCLSEGLVPC